MGEPALQIRENGPAYFHEYGKIFQEKIFQGLAMDKDWAQQMHEVMRPHYFELQYLQYLTERYFDYFDKYRCFPTMQLLISNISSELDSHGSDAILKQQVIAFLHRMRANPHPEDLHGVKEQALNFCKRQAFKDALVEAVELAKGDNFESVVDLMKKAVSVGMEQSVGHDFFDDMEARFQNIVRITSPTGLEELDAKDVLDGGLGQGELGVVVAPTGVGKSHWLVAMGAEALKRGKTVVHYTFELSETLTGKRYDANLTGVPVSDLIEEKAAVIKHYEDNPDYGRLVIKYYPCNSATVTTLRNHLEKLKFRGYMPSLVIVDYADEMRSTRQYEALRHELKLVYQELRQFAADMSVPVWTASQSNKSGADSDIVGLENMGEAYGKAQVSDFVVGLSRKPEEKDKGIARLFVAKNRAGRDGIKMFMKIDTSRSQFSVMDHDEWAEQDPKNLLKEAWGRVKKVREEMGEYDDE